MSNEHASISHDNESEKGRIFPENFYDSCDLCLMNSLNYWCNFACASLMSAWAFELFPHRRMCLSCDSAGVKNMICQYWHWKSIVEVTDELLGIENCFRCRRILDIWFTLQLLSSVFLLNKTSLIAFWTALTCRSLSTIKLKLLRESLICEFFKKPRELELLFSSSRQIVRRWLRNTNDPDWILRGKRFLLRHHDVASTRFMFKLFMKMHKLLHGANLGFLIADFFVFRSRWSLHMSWESVDFTEILNIFIARNEFSCWDIWTLP